MGLWSTIRGLFRTKASPPAFDWASAHKQIFARYDSALLTDENSRRWQQIDYLSARAANNYQVRRYLRAKSRYMVDNNSFARGIIDTKVGHLVGTGPVPVFRTGDENVDRKIKQRWLEWSDEVGFLEKIITIATGKMVSGEGVLLRKNDPKSKVPVQLYWQDVECDQITALYSPTDFDQYYLDGVEIDNLGRPVEYTYLHVHPGDYLLPQMLPWKTSKIKADQLVFWFKKTRPSQIRGIPELCSALDLFEQMRAYRINELTNKELQACYTVYYKNMQLGVGGLDLNNANPVTPNPMKSSPIERGMATELPAGYEPVQMEPRISATDFESFVYMLLAEACRCIRVPLNLALGTSQKFNFASARLDHLDYRDDLKVERKRCEQVVLKPIADAWLEEAVSIPGYLPSNLGPELVKVRWHWPGWSFMDPFKDAKADGQRLSDGTMTYEDYWAEQGEDWEEKFEQRGREVKKAEEEGFTLPQPKAAGGTDQVGEALDEREAA